MPKLKGKESVATVFRTHSLPIGLSVACGLFFSASTLVPPLYIRGLIASITTPSSVASSDSSSIRSIVISLIALFLLRGIARYVYGIASHRAAYALLNDLLQRLYTHMQQLSHRFFSRSRRGELIAQSIGDVESLEDFVAHGVPELVQAVAIPFAMTAVLIGIDPTLTIFVLIPLPVATLGIFFVSRNSRSQWHHVRERYAQVVAIVEDNLMGMNEIKSFTREEEQARLVAARSSHYRDSIIRATDRSMIPSGIVEMMGGIGIVLAIALGGASTVAGRLSVADLYVFIAYLGFIYQPFLKLADIADVLYKAMASYRRINDLLSLKPDIVSPVKAKWPRSFSGSIELQNVTFSYHHGVPVLSQMNLSVNEEEIVSLVGSTGAGKTTITRLIPRFYDPDSGKVLVGGSDVRSLDLNFLRRQVSMVSQDVFLFHGSISENILFGRPNASNQDLRDAISAANAEQFIKELPDGYETVVGDLGVRLSGGQRQRIAIARAILKDAPILILDEATSSVDTETEDMIQEALARLLIGRTAMIIAHRRSTIERAARVIVIEGGCVAESGSVNELRNRKSRYLELVQTRIGPLI